MAKQKPSYKKRMKKFIKPNESLESHQAIKAEALSFFAYIERKRAERTRNESFKKVNHSFKTKK